tara:strand:- start:393 stop:2210 length:1818 start_codon:yes stop_codon:yes gene_type:complete
MTYFVRTIFIYLILFGVTAYAVNRGVQHYFPRSHVQDDTRMAPTSLTFGLPSFIIPPRETETGLLLAGLAAQNRRDWGAAWQSFSALNEKYSENPDFALRAFTLALGNGEYHQAERIAANLNILLDEADIQQQEAEKFDLVRLFRIFSLLKAKDYDGAVAMTDKLANGALASFSVPVIRDWALAETNPSAITASTSGLNPLQLLYKAYAAEYAERKDIAQQVMGRVDLNILTPTKIAEIAEFYVRMGKTGKAIDILRRNLVKYEGNETLGILLAELQNAADSDTDIKSAPLSLTPQSAIAGAFHDFAMVMLSEGAFDSTLLFARLAAYLDPETPGVYSTMGDILKFQEQYDQALAVYSHIDVEDPDYKEAVANQVDLHIRVEQPEKAERLIQDALRTENDRNINESPEFYFLLGNLMQDDKRYDNALQAYNTAERLGKAQNNGELPQSLWPIYYSRAVVYDLTGQWEKAEADLQQAMEKFPNNPIILNYIGYAYADRNINLDKAKQMISQAVMAAPNDAYIVDSMGWILYRTGDYTNAVNFLERAASLKPYHMVINDHLGDAYWQVGRKIEAHYMWQRALNYYDDEDEEQRRMIDATKNKLKKGL